MSDEGETVRDTQGNAIDGRSERRAGRKAFEKFVHRRAAAATIEERNATVRASARMSAQGHRLCRAECAGLARSRAIMLKAKDLPEVMRLHSEYVQEQMRTLAEQPAKWPGLGKAAMDAAKPKA